MNNLTSLTVAQLISTARDLGIKYSSKGGRLPKAQLIELIEAAQSDKAWKEIEDKCDARLEAEGCAYGCETFKDSDSKCNACYLATNNEYEGEELVEIEFAEIPDGRGNDAETWAILDHVFTPSQMDEKLVNVDVLRGEDESTIEFLTEHGEGTFHSFDIESQPDDLVEYVNEAMAPVEKVAVPSWLGFRSEITEITKLEADADGVVIEAKRGRGRPKGSRNRKPGDAPKPLTVKQVRCIEAIQFMKEKGVPVRPYEVAGALQLSGAYASQAAVATLHSLVASGIVRQLMSAEGSVYEIIEIKE